MYCFLVATLLVFLASAQDLTDVQRQCIAANSEALSNDFLLGSWYEMYHFSLFGGMVPSQACTEIRFSKPSAEVIAEYKQKYNDPNFPYSLDDNPVIRNNSFFAGMVMGNNIAKFYVLEPKETSVLSGGFSVTAFRPLNDKYIMWQDCAMRGNMMQLYGRDRNAPVAEMEELIKNTPELERLQKQRFCSSS